MADFAASQSSRERRDRIRDDLGRDGEVRSSDLARKFRVSIETIRRDLEFLERRGVAQRQHGGATTAMADSARTIGSRIGAEKEGKERIARLAAGMVRAGQTVFIGAGSTTLAMAWELRNGPIASCTTNMIDIALALGNGVQDDITLIGGRYFEQAHATGGFENLEMIARRRYDIAFVGLTAIDLHRGYLAPSEAHAASVRTIRQSSKKLVVLATASKFGAEAFFEVLKLHEVDVVVTDRAPASEFYVLLESNGTEVHF